MGLIRRLNRWRERADGTLSGPALQADGADITDAATVTIDVPSDASTWSEALSIASAKYRSREAEVVINIETGHAITTSIEPQQCDLSYVRITSEDAQVPVTSDVTGHLINPGPDTVLPILDTVIDMGGLGLDGIFTERGCHVFVKDGAGIKNAGRHNLDAIGSRVHFEAGPDGTVWTGATERGIMITNGSVASIPGPDVSNNGDFGLYVSRGSMCYAETVDPNDTSYSDTVINNNGNDGIRVRRSFAVVRFAEATGNTGAGLWVARNSRVEAEQANLSGNSDYGCRAEHGSTVDLESADCSGADTCIVGRKGAKVVAIGADLTNVGTRSLTLRYKSEATVEGCNVEGNSTQAIFLREGSTVDVTNATTPDDTAVGSGDVNGMSSINAVEGSGIVFDDT